MKTQRLKDHTPVPWHVVEGQYNHWRIQAHDKYGHEFTIGEMFDKRRKGPDAQFIVRAVNNIESLQDQLSKLVQEFLKGRLHGLKRDDVYGAPQDYRIRNAIKALKESGYEYFDYDGTEV